MANRNKTLTIKHNALFDKRMKKFDESRRIRAQREQEVPVERIYFNADEARDLRDINIIREEMGLPPRSREWMWNRKKKSINSFALLNETRAALVKWYGGDIS